MRALALVTVWGIRLVGAGLLIAFAVALWKPIAIFVTFVGLYAVACLLLVGGVALYVWGSNYLRDSHEQPGSS